jgi:prolipoprotein diacylglyceryltransferase
VIWLDRRWKLGHGRAFALYVAAYGLGRLWIEGLRIDDAADVLGLRLNQVTALAAVVGGLTYFWLRRRTTRETVVEPEAEGADDGRQAEDAPDRTA